MAFESNYRSYSKFELSPVARCALHLGGGQPVFYVHLELSCVSFCSHRIPNGGIGT